jgi:hypothetical protein
MDISAMTGTTGIGLNAVISDCVVSGNASHGIATATAAGKAAISLLVDSCKVTGNFGSGINVNGAAASGAGSAIARIGNSTICLNVMGVSTTGSGALQSFKNNQIAGNFIDGTPLNAVPGYAAGTGQ